jgi:hypothetical protein
MVLLREISDSRFKLEGASRCFAFIQFTSVEHARQFVDAHYPNFPLGEASVRLEYSKSALDADDWPCGTVRIFVYCERSILLSLTSAELSISREEMYASNVALARQVCVIGNVIFYLLRYFRFSRYDEGTPAGFVHQRWHPRHERHSIHGLACSRT